MQQTYQQFETKTWWGGIWRGLVVDGKAKHYRAMRNALWLLIYFVIHADRKTGALCRKYETIARDMGVSIRTVRYWLITLRRHGYIKVETSPSSSAFSIHIQKWKPLKTTPS